jgi:hypothetical protein
MSPIPTCDRRRRPAPSNSLSEEWVACAALRLKARCRSKALTRSAEVQILPLHFLITAPARRTRTNWSTNMMDDFEDHCWKDMVTPDILEIYGDYARGPRLDKSGKPLPPHHNLYARYRGPYSTPPAALPHAPEYGLLRQVPPNAIRGPGHTFVPGVGILGESCDLPTSACTNEYRDVH